MDFQVILRKFMDQRNLNQYTLSKICKLPQPTICRWMSGVYLPTLEKLNTMCLNMGITLAEFFAEAAGATLVMPNRESEDVYSTAITQHGESISAEISNVSPNAVGNQSIKRQLLHTAIGQLLDEFEI